MDVCFQLHDEKGTYCRIIGTSIFSLLKNTKQPVSIHFLCDDTLTSQNKALLKKMVEEDFGQKIFFYRVQTDALLQRLDQEGRWYYSIATFYRLYLINILPSSVERIICLDADLIINMDIAKLWNENFEGYAVMAVQDSHINDFIHPLCRDGVLNPNQYFNAGVLYLNCKYIRENLDMVADSLNFIRDHYAGISCGDQDALNYLFANKCKYVDSIFNISVKKEREKKNYQINPAIYHFLNRMHLYNIDDSYGQLYYKYFFATPWGGDAFNIKWLQSIYFKLSKQMNEYSILLETLLCARNKKIVYWGISIEQLPPLLLKIPRKPTDYCVDNNPKRVGQKVLGMDIRAPEILLTEAKDNMIVVVMSKYHYPAIRNQLLEYGFQEYQDFFPAYMFEENCYEKALSVAFNIDAVE